MHDNIKLDEELENKYRYKLDFKEKTSIETVVEKYIERYPYLKEHFGMPKIF